LRARQGFFFIVVELNYCKKERRGGKKKGKKKRKEKEEERGKREGKRRKM